MISNIDQNNVEEAVEVMKKNMTNMMKEGVWVVAAYTREMIFIEEIKRHKDVQTWINLDISLSTIKTRLTSIKGMNTNLKITINTYDTDFNEMCRRLAKTWE